MKRQTVTFYWVFLVFCVGCASTEVVERHPYTGERIARPDHIIIYDFAATPADVPAGSVIAGRYSEHRTPQTPEQIEVGRKLGAQVAKELVSEIRAMGLPAVRGGVGTEPRVGDIVIRGYFVSLSEGKASERMLVGFGSGSADLRTVVEGYHMTPQGLNLLGTGQLESKGSKTPGMLVGLAALAATGSPIGLIVGGGAKLAEEKTGSETIESAAKRTVKEIVEQLQPKFKEQGWI